MRPDASLPDTAKITIGWLLDGVASGRLPDPGAITAKEAADNTFRLSLEQSNKPERARRCQPLGKPVTLRLNKGDAFGIREGSFAGGSVRVSPMPGQGLATVALSFNPERGNTLAAASGPLVVRAAPENPFLPVLVCDE